MMQTRQSLYHFRTRWRGVSLLFGLIVLGGLTPAFAGITIAGGNRDVSTLCVTVNGTLTSVGAIGMWYEVRQGAINGVLLDYGARSRWHRQYEPCNKASSHRSASVTCQ